jgi:hypothetical protein
MSCTAFLYIEGELDGSFGRGQTAPPSTSRAIGRTV